MMDEELKEFSDEETAQEAGDIPEEESQEEVQGSLARATLIALPFAIALVVGILLIQGVVPGSFETGTDQSSGVISSELRHPCDIVSSSELEGYVEISLSEGRELVDDKPLGGLICGFANSETDTLFMRIELYQTELFDPFFQDAGYNAVVYFDGNQGPEGATEPVAGLGSRAYWGGPGVEVWNGLHVLEGDTYLQVIIVSKDAVVSQTDMVEVAELVLDGMY